MIVGIGNDLLDIGRVEALKNKESFLKRYFTKEEISLFTRRKYNVEVIAGNFCVKESVVKALGVGFKDFSLTDIEVLRDDVGKPYINLYDKCLEISNNLGINRWHVTISHTKKYVHAVVIGETVD